MQFLEILLRKPSAEQNVVPSLENYGLFAGVLSYLGRDLLDGATDYLACAMQLSFVFTHQEQIFKELACVVTIKAKVELLGRWFFR